MLLFTIARTRNTSIKSLSRPTVSQISRFATSARMSTGKQSHQHLFMPQPRPLKLKPSQKSHLRPPPPSTSKTQTSPLPPASPSPRSNKQSSPPSSTSSPAVHRCRNSLFGATMRPSRTRSLSLRAARSTRLNGMGCRVRSVRLRDSIIVSRMRGILS